MKRRHLAGLAAFWVGAMGGAAFGDHHGGGDLGGWADCSACNHTCWAECDDLNACLMWGEEEDCWAERLAFETCCARPPPPPPWIIVLPPPPACPEGQHLNGEGECQDDYECGDDEIGGGAEECEACPDGTEPNEDGTACEQSSTYRVAKCTRPVEALPVIGEFLPHHVNVVSESTSDDRMELGFFAVDMTHAVLSAWAYRQLNIRQFTAGSLERDPNLGECTYKTVSKEHFEIVRNRMETYRWNRYHLVLKNYSRYGYGSCITWAEAVTGG